MSRADKEAAVAALASEFRESSGAVLTDYRGLSVDDLKQLRRALGESATYAIVKNTLTKIAAKDAGVDGIEELLTGPSAIAFVKGDAVDAAKGLRDFGRSSSRAATSTARRSRPTRFGSWPTSSPATPCSASSPAPCRPRCKTRPRCSTPRWPTRLA
jgi:ribosomal protein L10